jgi:hypothetical protein
MLRKTLVIENNLIIKKYGSLNTKTIDNLITNLCNFYSCYSTTSS